MFCFKTPSEHLSLRYICFIILLAICQKNEGQNKKTQQNNETQYITSFVVSGRQGSVCFQLEIGCKQFKRRIMKTVRTHNYIDVHHTQACLVPVLGISCLQQLTLHNKVGSLSANALTLTCQKCCPKFSPGPCPSNIHVQIF